jgi:hypothetical protein
MLTAGQILKVQNRKGKKQFFKPINKRNDSVMWASWALDKT